MEFTPRLTKHQIARGSRPDAENKKEIHLIKGCSMLGATYQVRLLAYRAFREKRKLVVTVPTDCILRPSLAALRREFPGLIRVRRVPMSPTQH
jgi:hypothetical protein